MLGHCKKVLTNFQEKGAYSSQGGALSDQLLDYERLQQRVKEREAKVRDLRLPALGLMDLFELFVLFPFISLLQHLNVKFFHFEERLGHSRNFLSILVLEHLFQNRWNNLP
jgi:hypothetical protein